MHRNLRRVFNNGQKRTRSRHGTQIFRSPLTRAREFAKWLEENTDATHIEVEHEQGGTGYEVTWLEPVKKVR